MQSKRASIAIFALGFTAILLLVHLPYFDLPFFWDELGQFVPASLDLLRHGLWIPESTLPNVHPPGVMAYLALAWKIFGFSIPATRIAMLVLASAGVLFSFLLAIRLSRNLPGAPAFAAVAFLIATPIFYTQSMMALLDMPAMVFTALALLLFLNDRIVACVAACTVLVLMKETAISTPFVMAVWLMFREKRVRESLYFLTPALALGAWLMVLHHATGHWLGNDEFAKYNVSESLTFGHIWGSIYRRIYFLFFADGLWIGAIVLYLGRRVFRRQNAAKFAQKHGKITAEIAPKIVSRDERANQWTIAFLVAGAQLLVVSVFGGAALDRYTMPAFPVLYAAIAAAGTMLATRWRGISRLAMIFTLLAGLWWNPPYPFSFENNLAMMDFVALQSTAAEYLETHVPNARVATAWPLTDALHRPEFGYVQHPMRVQPIDDFQPVSLDVLQHRDFDVLVVYCRVWGLDTVKVWPSLNAYLARVWGLHHQATADQIRATLGFVPAVRWDRRGQWIEIYVPETAVAGTESPAMPALAAVAPK